MNTECSGSLFVWILLKRHIGRMPAAHVGLLAQAAELLWTLLYTVVMCAIDIPIAAFLCMLEYPQEAEDKKQVSSTCIFYEGTVDHERKKPVHHAFRQGDAQDVCTHSNPLQSSSGFSRRGECR